MQLVREKSRLKKKLTLYFILISVVSISVSAEIIFEFSSGKFRSDVTENLLIQVQKGVSAENLKNLDAEQMKIAVKKPISDLRNRMILLLLVVFASIVGAFIMFARDIVSPMDGIVEATKKIADGDLTVTVPVMTDDEIGQIATLINDMNINLQDMIMQIRQEVARHRIKIKEATDKITGMIYGSSADEIIENRKMKISDFQKMTKLNRDVIKLLETMLTDLGALETFVKMYKTYAVHTEIKQREIDRVLQEYNANFDIEEAE